MSKRSSINISWLFKMAWRDSRRNRPRLLLFISSIILGIAALVALYSFGDNLQKDIDRQAATLLGADLVVSSNKPVPNKTQEFIRTLGDQRSEERSCVSMVYFPRSSGTRLVQVRALGGRFPYYGEIETEPQAAGRSFRRGRNALVDKTLMLQFGLAAGDSIKVGELSFKVVGALTKAPGETGFSSSIAPVVYIPLEFFTETGLSQKGSRITYNFYFKYQNPRVVPALIKKLGPELDGRGLDYQTVESRKQNTGRAFEDLTRFLTLVGFIALLLGCIGVASSIHIYIREKLSTIAILRCLGVKAWQAFFIYLLQIVGIGLLGSVIGAILGTFLQQLLPVLLRDFLPVQTSLGISWSAVLMGLVLGLIISVLFALLPLVSIRRISPLNTLRMSFERSEVLRDPLNWLVYALICIFIVSFTYLELDDWLKAAYFSGGLAVAFLFLTFSAWVLIYSVRRFFPVSWSYVWRQGLLNLFRPNNQTIVLVVSIGLGTAFICTLFFIQDILLKRVTLSASGKQPNMVLFDIQTSQKQAVANLTRQYHLPVLQQVPIVTTRIAEVKGHTAVDAVKDTSLKYLNHAFNNEIRVTYRDSLTSTEKLTGGSWTGLAGKQGRPVPISIEENFARRLKVKVGDPMVFNVQGVPVPVVVGSLRSVNWNRIQTNFRVVFPQGVLEDAPQFHVIITRVPSPEKSVDFQRAVVRQFPNISIIDLKLILSILDEILSQIGFVIKFMAGFSMITGLVVLIASILISKYQRVQESVLLRTLGASRRQILVITACEYFFLGALAALSGILLSLAGSWLLAKYNFDSEFVPSYLAPLILFLTVTLLTVLIGLFNSRDIVQKPPLEILRGEV